jgi:haloacid dehalogenase-like hydrolase
VASIDDHRIQVGKLPGDTEAGGVGPRGAQPGKAGLHRLVMLTGDRAEPAREVATVLGLDAVYADQSPADKVAAVRGERERAVTVMAGDGVNDAPALAAATVGVAMGARGATASSEAADVVLTSDRVDRLADAMDIARWSRRIAVQSAVVGMSLSLAAMAIAAVGWLPPAAGALLQEGIDIAVILNALRALRGNPAVEVELPTDTEQMLRRFAAEHDELRDTVGLLRDVADRLAAGADAAALASLTRAHAFLTERILPHEGTVNLRSCGRSANHISLIRHTRPGESQRRTGENRPRIAQVDSAGSSVVPMVVDDAGLSDGEGVEPQGTWRTRSSPRDMRARAASPPSAVISTGSSSVSASAR